VIVHSQLVTDTGASEALDWIFAPAEERLGGRLRHGFRYGYRFRSGNAQVRMIMDRATWEVGGKALGLRVGQDLHPLTAAGQYCLQWDWRYVGGELFDYQTSAAGTLLTYPADYRTSLFARAATPDFLIFQNSYHFPEPAEAATPLRTVLYDQQQGGADDWAQLRTSYMHASAAS